MRDASLFLGERVFVYFNLHRKCWSVKLLRTGRVVGHHDHLVLRDCAFKVSAKGRRRVLKERRRNVHAGVVGILAQTSMSDVAGGTPIAYNPYKYETFVEVESGDPVFQADVVALDRGKVRRLA